MFKVILILAIFGLAMIVSAQQFQTVFAYPRSTCSGGAVVLVTQVSSGGCSARGCTCQSGVCGKLTCSNSLTLPSGGFAGFASYSDSACANLVLLTGYSSGCISYLGNSFSSTCNSANVTISTYAGSSSCSGTAVSSTYSTVCQSGFRGYCSNPATIVFPSLFILLALLFLLF